MSSMRTGKKNSSRHCLTRAAAEVIGVTSVARWVDAICKYAANSPAVYVAETLERRNLLTGSNFAAFAPSSEAGGANAAQNQILAHVPHGLHGTFSGSKLDLSAAPVGNDYAPGYILQDNNPQLSGSGQLDPFSTASPTGLTPAQMRQAYGVNNIIFGSVTGDGTGQTIAIIDAYDYPTAASDLHAFDQQFGLADPPSFTKVNETGGTTLPGTDPSAKGSDWELEEALDIEWTHAMAPGANILLVEANSASDSDLITTAVGYARSAPGVSAISMSFGRSESSVDVSEESVFTTPTGHQGVTFLASTGDSGAPGEFPAYSPNVVAVGGTYLLAPNGTYSSEQGWSGSGGGISSYESQPSYQNGIVTQSTTYRTIPDVSFDASPSSGASVYDSYDYGTTDPWQTVGGTSLASPSWAGLIAIANQGRVLDGASTLDGPSQTLSRLYSMPSSDFHDVTTGTNPFPAGVGYDLVTGRGSPVANSLIVQLSAGGPYVTSAAPTGIQSAAPSDIDFNFSVAMNPASFTIGSGIVSFTGPGNTNLSSQITGFSWLNGNTTLEVDFSAQATQGPYTMTLSSQIQSASGVALDQNQNGINGETTADRYTAVVYYDVTPTQVSSTTPANGATVAPPFTTLNLNFSAAYNPATVSTTNLTLNQGTVTAATVVNSTTVAYTIGGITRAGTITATLVQGALTDANGNPILAFSGTYVIPSVAAPSAPVLLATTDSGASNSDGITNFNNSTTARALQFTVGNTIAGDTVIIYVDGVAVGSAVATGATTTVVTNGTSTLSQGVHSVVASQGPVGGQSANSAATSITVLTTAPTISTTAGALDTTLNFTGSVVSPQGLSSAFASVAVQSNGDIVAVGTGYAPNYGTTSIAVARYSPNGTLDTTFGGTGVVITPVSASGSPDLARAVIVQPDGKIVVVGYEQGFSGVLGAWPFIAMRYNVNGTLDTTFGNGGKVVSTLNGSFFQAQAAALQPDGKIVICGYSGNTISIVRLTTSGTFDTTFNGTGYGQISFGNLGDMDAVAIMSNGDIVLGGYTSPSGGGSSLAAVARLTPTGSLDTTFDSTGYNIIGTLGNVIGLALEPNGQIIIASPTPTTNVSALARINTDGTQDLTFGTGGLATFSAIRVSGVAVDSSGKIVAAGESTTFKSLLVRFNANGTPDTTFGSNGIDTVGIGTGTNLFASVTIAPDGRIVAAGSSTDPTNSGLTDFTIARFTNAVPTLAIDPGSDSGVSNSDGITNINTPTLDVTGAQGLYFRIYRNGSLITPLYSSGTTIVLPAQPTGTASYTMTLVDAAGNESSQSSAVSFTIDTTAPTAGSFSTPALSSIAPTCNFSVTYSDNFAVAVATLDNNDILVTGPNGYSQLATFVSASPNSNASSITATYQISAPTGGGGWGAPGAAYIASLQSNQVSDVAGNFVAAGTLGSIVVAATATPGQPQLVAATDSGISASDGITNFNNSSSLAAPQFSVSGTVAGDLVTVYADGVPIGNATAAGTTTIVTGDGVTILTNGAHSITARQTQLGAQSVDSSPLSIIVDQSPPTASFGSSTISGSNFNFTITYADNQAVAFSSLGGSNILVTGPGNYSQFAALVSASPSSNSASITATYSMTPPSGGWGVSGTSYAVTLEPNQVSDVAGNFVSSGALGAVTVGANAAPGQPQLLAATDSGVSNSDGVTNFDNSSISKALQFLVPGTVAGDVVNIYADGVSIGSATAQSTTTMVTTNGLQALANGIHSITARQVQFGMSSGDSPALPITVDTVAPTGAVVGALVPSGGNFNFTVTFSDNVAVNAAGLGSTNILVTGTGYSQFATFVSATPSGNGTPITATYQMAPPSGGWGSPGIIYTATLAASQIADTAGNFAAGGALGTLVQTAAATPGKPQLAAATDSGSSNSDGITNFDNSSPAKAPQFSVSPTVNGELVTIYADGVAIGSALATGTTTTITANGSYALSSGAHSITARQVATGYLQSAASTSLSITIETSVPTPVAPTLDPTSDSGTSNSDGITNDFSPLIDVNAPEAGTLSVETDGNPATIVNQVVAGPGIVGIRPSVVSFNATINSPAGLAGNVMAAGDFNGDGKLDIVDTSPTLQTASILLGNGNGTFQAATTLNLSAANGDGVVVGDFNGDGKADLAFATGGGVKIFLGNGNGTFGAGTLYAASGASDLAVGDLNGDGKLDLVATNFGSPTGSIFVLMGNGNGTFSAATTFAAGAVPYHIKLADMNGDGKLDVVVASGNVSAATNDVAILLGNGNGTFGAPATFATGATYVYGIGVGDFNGDGHPDVVASFGNSTCKIYLGNGNGTLAAPTTLTLAGTNTQTPAIGDFNGDGKLDLAVSTGTATSGTVNLFFGNGNGTFQADTTFAVGTGPQMVLAGDFNGDGKLDLATPNSLASSVSVLLANGGMASGAHSITAWETDAAGNTSAVSNPLSLSIDLTSPAATLVAPSPVGGASFTVSVTYTDASGVNIATLGNNNIVVTGPNGYSQLATYVSASQGVSGSPITATYRITGPGGIWSSAANGTYTVTSVGGQVGDIAGNYASAGLIGTFSVSITAAPTSVQLAAATDSGVSNSDGITNFDNSSLAKALQFTMSGTTFGNSLILYADGVAIGTATAQGSTSTLTTNGMMQLSNGVHAITVIQTATGSAQSPPSAAISITIDTIAPSAAPPPPIIDPASDSGASNSDGVTNVALPTIDVTTTEAGAVYVEADGNPSLVTSVVAAGAGSVQLTPNFPVSFTTGASISLGTSAGSAVAAADFNGDGKLDLVVGTQTGEYLFLGNGNGTFQAGQQISTFWAFAFTVADLNDDGRPDLLSQLGGGIQVLLNNGAGGFTAEPNPSVSGGGTFAVGDLNGDGIPDIVHCDTSTISVLLGNGNGTFGAAKTFATSSNSENVVLGDFNGDGKLDAAYGIGNVAQIGLMLGNGNGTFGPQTTIAIGGTYDGIVKEADFNHDGKMDLYVASGAYGSTSNILLGNGNGTFTSISGPANPSNFPSAVVGDFNNDGNLDLALQYTFSTTAPNTILLYLGNGNGTFKAAQTFATGIYPEGIAAADFNGDGRLDLATANTDSMNVSVLMGVGGAILPGSHTLTAWYTDLAGNASPLSTATSIDIDTTPPTASNFVGPAVTSRTSALTFTVTYSDTIGVNVASLASTNILVTGTSSYSQYATFVSANPATNGTPIVATYQVSPPSGGWPLNGVYTATLAASQVDDIAGNYAAAGALGTFGTGMPTTTVVTSSNASTAFGQTVTFTATVTPTGSGETGTVQFMIDGSNAGSAVTLSGNIATYTTSTLGGGSHLVVAVYSGDSSFATSSSAAFTQTINKLAPSAGWWALNPLISFASAANPYGGTILDSSGDLFGTTSIANGTIFEIAHGSTSLTTLATFNGTNGATPEAGLVSDSSGDLFGTTYTGGNGTGVVFELVHGASTITRLASFNTTNGANPEAGVVLDAAGDVFGTTYNGGANSDGVVFEVVNGSGSITTLASFNGTNGSHPESSVVLDSSGNLYGAAYNGGANNDGDVFEIASGSNSITALASFNVTNGDDPDSIAIDSSGNLFGAADAGASNYGGVFEVQHGATSISLLAPFNSTNGSNPLASVILDSNDDVFGTTYIGGTGGYGTVFELANGSNTISSLFSFNSTNGKEPRGNVAMDSSGDLFSTTYAGGANANGNVFELRVATGAVSSSASYGQAVSFVAAVSSSSTVKPTGTVQFQLDGSNVGNPVTLSALGTATYSTSSIPAGTNSIVAVYSGDGNYAGGTTATFTQTISQVASSTFWSMNALASFNNTNGDLLYGGVVFDSSGDLFGTTYFGGANSEGEVFEIAHGATSVAIIASFNKTNGEYPDAGVTLDTSGDIFGTTLNGGNLTVNSGNGYGEVYEIVHGTSSITVLATFNGTNGSSCEASVVLDSSGDVFGTTESGGVSSDGEVFEVVNGSGSITPLAAFNVTNGGNPTASVTLDTSGDVFGTASTGGAHLDGVVFEVVHNATTLTDLASFNGTNGGDAQSSVVFDAAGDMFGTATNGGANNDGTVFEMVHGSGVITALASFNGVNGQNPEVGVVLDPAGDVFGTTYFGGYSNLGTVFELPYGSGTITALESFTGTNGQSPRSVLVTDSLGNLYGTTLSGGANTDGEVFEVHTGGSSTYGQSVTLTVSVPPSLGVGATGTVQFKVNGSNFGSPVTLSSQTASLTTSALPVGTDLITAVYSGDNNFITSTSPVYTQTVAQVTPTLTWVTPGAITYGTGLSAAQLDASASVAGSYSYSPSLGTVLNAGTQTLSVTFTPTDTIDYTTATTSVSLTVNKASLTVTANSTSKTYGSANPLLGDTISGFVNGDTAAVVSGAASLSTTATTSSSCGSYPITVGLGTLAAANYTFSLVNGTLTVNPATLTVTATSTTKTYGSANPTLGDTITGLVNGDSISVVTGAPSLATTATTSGGVGSYPITVALGTLAASNYSFSFVNGSLSVNPASLTVTATSTSKTYGSANPTLGDSITGFVNGDSSSVISGAASLTTSATTSSGVGSYPITAALGTLAASNYSFSFVNGSLTVNPALLTVTATSMVKTYGSANPTLADTITGFVNGDDVSVVSGVASLSTTATASSGVGSYPIIAAMGTLAASNYTFAVVNGSLTINPATLTVTVTSTSKTYGSANPALADIITGFVNGDSSSVVTGAASLSTAATTSSGVGSYPINATLGTLAASNYSFSFVAGSLTINAAPLTVTATSTSKIYGSANPTFADTITGFVNGDGISVVSGSASLSTTATSASGVGSYPITAAIGTLTASNYTFSFVNGSLTVNPATLTVTATSATLTYGSALPSLGDTITGFVNGDNSSIVTGSPSLTTTATSSSGVGSYPITAALGTLAATNYSFTFVNGTVLVNPASLTVTATSASMTYGSAIPVLADTITGFVNGDNSSVVSGAASLTTTATSSSGVGSYPITVALGTLAASNYSFSFVNGSLSVNPASLTVTATSASKTYGSANPTLADTITGFVNGDSSSVVSGSASLSTTATSASGVGSYPITATIGTLTASNYIFSFVNGSLAVNPATLTVMASSASMTYGSTVPSLGDMITGFVNGDSSSVVSGSPGLTTTATTSSGVGSYPITASLGSLAASNYTFSFINGSLTINPATLTVTATSTNKTYGSPNPTFADTITGFVNGDNSGVVSGSPGLTTSATSSSGVGNYAISAAIGSLAASNYTFSFVNGLLAVNPATLTVMASSTSKTYGSANPTFADSITGFVNGDASSVVSGAPGLTTTATAASGVGSYPITATQGTLTALNYTFSLVNGTLTINPATLSVTAHANSKTSGTTASDTGTVTGQQNGDAITGKFASSGDMATAQAGIYPISYTLSGPDIADYTVAFTPANLVVNAAVGPSHVTPLAQTQTTKTFPVSVTGTAADVAFEIYVSTNGSAFTYWTTVPASNPTATFTGAGITSYAFHSIAMDSVGDLEVKAATAIDASTYLPALDAPVTSVASVTPNSAGLITVNFNGTDPDGVAIAKFYVYMSMDGGAKQLIATVPGGTPVNGVYSGTTSYQAPADGTSHTYVFWTDGADASTPANVQADPANLTTTYSTPANTTTFTQSTSTPLSVAAFVVQNGLAERSFINTLAVTFSLPVGGLNLGLGTHVTLTQYANAIVTTQPGGSASPPSLGAGTAVNLSGVGVTATGNTLSLNFGQYGLGGANAVGAAGANTSTTADGFYALTFTNINGTGYSQTLYFYRLLGDVDGNGIVNATDASAVAAAVGQTGSNLNDDVAGEGTVNSLDKTLAIKEEGRQLMNGLLAYTSQL